MMVSVILSKPQYPLCFSYIRWPLQLVNPILVSNCSHTGSDSGIAGKDSPWTDEETGIFLNCVYKKHMLTVPVLM